jgi:hypothetical protein
MIAEQRGRLAAGVDAAGAAMGCVGLTGFAVTSWELLSRMPLWESLALGPNALGYCGDDCVDPLQTLL